MAELSKSELDWHERAAVFNYCCRICRNPITFVDQELYFVQGLCRPCLEGLIAERSRSNSDAKKRLEEIRARGPYGK